MKILIATDNYFPNINGGALLTRNLGQHFVAKGNSVTILCPAQRFRNTSIKKAGVKVRGIRSFKIPPYIYPGNFRIPLIFNTKLLREIILEEKPDVIHIHDHFMICDGVVKIAKQLNIPIVGTNHFMPENLIHYLYPPYSPKFVEETIYTFAWKQFVSVYNRLDLVITPTQTAANILKKGGIKKPRVAISNGVDLSRFNIQVNKSEVKKKYKIPEGKPVLLFVGRLDKEKKVEVVLESLRIITESQKAHLVITGKGQQQLFLSNLARQLNISSHITFTGFVPEEDLPKIYRIADIFVMASTAELQSVATLEALASGLPIVAAKAIALPELVHQGKNGFLFPPNNSKSLAKKVLMILNNSKLKNKMSSQSLKIVQAHDFTQTVKEHLSIYKQVVLEKRNKNTKSSLDNFEDLFSQL